MLSVFHGLRYRRRFRSTPSSTSIRRQPQLTGSARRPLALREFYAKAPDCPGRSGQLPHHYSPAQRRRPLAPCQSAGPDNVRCAAIPSRQPQSGLLNQSFHDPSKFSAAQKSSLGIKFNNFQPLGVFILLLDASVCAFGFRSLLCRLTG